MHCRFLGIFSCTKPLRIVGPVRAVGCINRRFSTPTVGAVVFFTAASQPAGLAAEACPTCFSSEIAESASVDVTSCSMLTAQLRAGKTTRTYARSSEIVGRLSNTARSNFRVGNTHAPQRHLRPKPDFSSRVRVQLTRNSLRNCRSSRQREIRIPNAVLVVVVLKAQFAGV